MNKTERNPDELSLSDRLRYGNQMIQQGGWQVEALSSSAKGTEYWWISKRGERFDSFAINYPPPEAIANALKNKDIK